jgi:hypothetical protein
MKVRAWPFLARPCIQKEVKRDGKYVTLLDWTAGGSLCAIGGLRADGINPHDR